MSISVVSISKYGFFPTGMCNSRILKTFEQDRKQFVRVSAGTHKSTGRLNVYKGDFRCQHNVQQVSKHVKESKNTGCPVQFLNYYSKNLNYSSRVLKCSRRRGNQIPVQPTAIARRNLFILCRETQVGGRPVKRALPPALKEHTYGIFSELPKNIEKQNIV
ncbi:hypothetical protein HNY73_003472 [Argiope bruennichi]|uniref:Uncharacterized protein n=1 Tax=Argiope bruennichi TaxID=94029 RepID=A0A8T0FL94_ARGBR|nr:hypothetical protein HNY73_003472 [Argiope bruennichi]